MYFIASLNTHYDHPIDAGSWLLIPVPTTHSSSLIPHSFGCLNINLNALSYVK